MDVSELLAEMGVPLAKGKKGDLTVHSPINGSTIGFVTKDSPKSLVKKVDRAIDAFNKWRSVPAPRRGQLIRLFSEELRLAKEPLGRLVTIESGKSLQEGLGEVQEMVDICDFAVGLSRQLYGLTIASERPGHRMQEAWHPLGVTGVITAFNFPVAVFAWNFALAIVCGNPVIWKPSEKTPMTALAVDALFRKASTRFEEASDNLLSLAVGDRSVGEMLVANRHIPLISATGSSEMGREVGPRVAQRFGRSLLELGGNNAMIVTAKANLNLAIRAILFSAIGTAGQRCTSLRRLFVQETIYETLVPALKSSYDTITIGNPLDKTKLLGPLIDKTAYGNMQKALNKARHQGGKVHGGNRVLDDQFPKAYYVRPALVEIPEQTDIVKIETFAPVLYVIPYRTLEEAITLQNDVPQGLSSCIFTNDLREAEQFLSFAGSDCGIANVNIGPSGAEIGGAFGGEKETGGGRESGSDAWKNYMRRATNTINYSNDLPLAQGIVFDF